MCPPSKWFPSWRHLSVERAESADLALARRNRFRADVPRACRFAPSSPAERHPMKRCSKCKPLSIYPTFYRLGRRFWSVLESSVPITSAGREIIVGWYINEMSASGAPLRCCLRSSAWRTQASKSSPRAAPSMKSHRLLSLWHGVKTVRP